MGRSLCRGRAEEAVLNDPVDAVGRGELFPEVRAGIALGKRGKARAGLFLWGEKWEQAMDEAFSSSMWQRSPIRTLAGVW